MRRHIETNGYRCGDLVQVYANGDMAVGSVYDGEKEEPILFCREANLCGAAVEKQYYAPSDRTDRGKRIQTKYVCCHCYADTDLARMKDIEGREMREGRQYHPICKSCLKNGAPVVYIKGRKKNQVEASMDKRNRRSAGQKAHLGRKK